MVNGNLLKPNIRGTFSKLKSVPFPHAECPGQLISVAFSHDNISGGF